MSSATRLAVSVMALSVQLGACNRTDSDSSELRSSAFPDEIRDELERLGTEDQELRQGEQFAERIQDTTFVRRLLQADSARSQRLTAIVEQYGWPDTVRAGAEASQAAFLILQHSPIHEFMKEMAPLLEDLAKQDKVRRDEAAMLIDRVLMNDSLPQRYGTQFNLVDGRLIFYPVEDEAGLEERRAAMGLPTMAEYMRVMEEVYNTPVSRDPK